MREPDRTFCRVVPALPAATPCTTRRNAAALPHDLDGAMRRLAARLGSAVAEPVWLHREPDADRPSARR